MTRRSPATLRVTPKWCSGWCSDAVEHHPDVLGRRTHQRYALLMSSDRASESPMRLWKPHADDAADVREAMACADRGEFLSPAATEAFLMWMQGNGDESWRDELE
jgi:hypothetical protein